MKTTESFPIGEYITAKRHENGTWYLLIPTVSGTSKEVSTGIKGSRTAVKAWAKEHRIKEAAEATVSTRSARAVVDAMLVGHKLDWEGIIAEWKDSLTVNARAATTVARHVANMRRFIKEAKLEQTSPRDVTERQVFDWVNQPSMIGYSSRESLLQAVRGFFRFTQSRGYTIHNPASMVNVVRSGLTHEQLEHRPMDAFTPAQFSHLEAAIDQEIRDTLDHIEENPYRGARRDSRRQSLETALGYLRFWHAAIHYAYAIGLRISDIALLEWASLEKEGWVIVHTEKTHTRIAIPYTSEAIQERLGALPARHAGKKVMVEASVASVAPLLREAVRLTEDYRADQGEHARYCFPPQAKDYQSNHSKLSLYFRRLLNNHNLTTLSFHSLRHARIRDWNDKGIDLEVIGLHVGHASTKTTEGYLEK